jgi:hypothetical protein
MRISSPMKPTLGYFRFDGCSGTKTKYHERTTQQSRVVKMHDPTQLHLERQLSHKIQEPK